MSTTNVKILLRRGLRKDISHDTLETGEMGFTMDTNQLFIGIDPAINEVQFDPFANAQAVIQSWLNSADNPEAGLIVDEDLVIRNVSDVDALLSAMHYFFQTIVFDSVETFTPGETLFQYIIQNELESFTTIAAQTDFTINRVLTPTSLWSVSSVEVDGTATTDFTVSGQVVTITAPVMSGGETVSVTLTEQSIYTQGEILTSVTDAVAGTTTVEVKVSEPSSDPNSNPYMNGFYTETPSDEGNYYFSTQSTGTVEPTKATSITGASEFLGGLFGRARKNVEVVTENSFNEMFADQHLVSFSAASGLRSSLFKKELDGTTGTFMSWDKNICTSFFIDYSLVQTKNTSKFVRVGTIKVINGVPQGINDIKLTDDNTEIWQDLNTDSIADVDEFSNIEFTATIDGDNIKFNYTQEVDWKTEISYTVKRWTM